MKQYIFLSLISFFISTGLLYSMNNVPHSQASSRALSNNTQSTNGSNNHIIPSSWLGTYHPDLTPVGESQSPTNKKNANRIPAPFLTSWNAKGKRSHTASHISDGNNKASKTKNHKKESFLPASRLSNKASVQITNEMPVQTQTSLITPIPEIAPSSYLNVDKESPRPVKSFQASEIGALLVKKSSTQYPHFKELEKINIVKREKYATIYNNLSPSDKQYVDNAIISKNKQEAKDFLNAKGGHIKEGDKGYSSVTTFCVRPPLQYTPPKLIFAPHTDMAPKRTSPKQKIEKEMYDTIYAHLPGEERELIDANLRIGNEKGVIEYFKVWRDYIREVMNPQQSPADAPSRFSNNTE